MYIWLFPVGFECIASNHIKKHLTNEWKLIQNKQKHAGKRARKNGYFQLLWKKKFKLHPSIKKRVILLFFKVNSKMVLFKWHMALFIQFTTWGQFVAREKRKCWRICLIVLWILHDTQLTSRCKFNFQHLILFFLFKFHHKNIYEFSIIKVKAFYLRVFIGTHIHVLRIWREITHFFLNHL